MAQRITYWLFTACLLASCSQKIAFDVPKNPDAIASSSSSLSSSEEQITMSSSSSEPTESSAASSFAPEENEVKKNQVPKSILIRRVEWDSSSSQSSSLEPIASSSSSAPEDKKTMEIVKIGYKPCLDLREFSIGNVDNRFGISTEEFSSAVDAAVAQWEMAAGRQIFQRVPSGSMVISAVYDHRQAKWMETKAIHDKKENLFQTIETSQKEIEEMKKDFLEDQNSYTNNLLSFNKQKTEYESRVNMLNARGRVTPEEVQSIEKERLQIQAAVLVLQKELNEIQATSQKINGLIEAEHNLIREHNKLASDLKAYEGAEVAGMFKHEVTDAQEATDTIEIFAYLTKEALVGTIAHELGHSIAVPHLIDANAIMASDFSLFEDMPRVSSADIKALDTICKR